MRKYRNLSITLNVTQSHMLEGLGGLGSQDHAQLFIESQKAELRLHSESRALLL